MVFFEDKNDDGLLITELQTLNPDSLDVKQRLWYYPFGMHLEGIGQDSTAPAQAYRYNGKELDEATGLYDYGARYYDPAIARWGQIDPLADQYAPYSPYNYVLGNPISLVDPDGMRVDNTIFVDSKGKELYRTEDNLDDAVVIVSDENKNMFLAMSDAVQNTEEVNDSHIQWLRNTGDSYYTSAFDKLWTMGQNLRHSSGFDGIRSTIGDGSWIPEVGVEATRNSSGDILADWATFEDFKEPIENMHYYEDGTSFWHTHPEGDHYYWYKQSGGGSRRKKGSHKDGGSPSSPDMGQIRNREMNGHYNVAVLKTGYWFYNNKGSEFFISKTRF
jgi:RHS repeat-associated protein